MTVTFMKYTEDGSLLFKQLGLGIDYDVKVYPLVCDRLTLTCDIPPAVKSLYIGWFKQENATAKKGYKYSGMIKDVSMKTSPYLPDDEDKITSAYIQCDPFDHNVGFIRLDFNPATIDISQLKWLVNNNWMTHKLYGFDYLLEHGRVTRIDFAVDIAYEKVDDLYFYYENMQRVEVIRTFKGQTEYIESQTEYIGGKIKAAKRIAIYDRLPAIKAQNYKKYWDLNYKFPNLKTTLCGWRFGSIPNKKIPSRISYLLKIPLPH
jgi:hypothetical protein